MDIYGVKKYKLEQVFLDITKVLGGIKFQTKVLATPALTRGYGIASDSSGIYLTGMSAGSLDGTSGTGLFVIKYNSSGTIQ